MSASELLIKRLDAVVESGISAIASAKTNQYNVCDPALRAKFRASGLAFLKSLYGESDHHFADFYRAVDGVAPLGYERGIGILASVREELSEGWLVSTTSLIAGEVFSDFLEMSKHLLDAGYKDAAAVISGSSLESHLKRLATKHSVDVVKPNGDPRKADQINSDLHKASVYDLNAQKQVTAWLGIRNDAAHGDYDKVVAGAVDLMIQGIRFFVSTHPA